MATCRPPRHHVTSILRAVPPLRQVQPLSLAASNYFACQKFTFTQTFKCLPRFMKRESFFRIVPYQNESIIFLVGIAPPHQLPAMVSVSDSVYENKWNTPE